MMLTRIEYAVLAASCYGMSVMAILFEQYPVGVYFAVVGIVAAMLGMLNDGD